MAEKILLLDFSGTKFKLKWLLGKIVFSTLYFKSHFVWFSVFPFRKLLLVIKIQREKKLQELFQEHVRNFFFTVALNFLSQQNILSWWWQESGTPIIMTSWRSDGSVDLLRQMRWLHQAEIDVRGDTQLCVTVTPQHSPVPVTWSLSTNQRSISRSRDHPQPIRDEIDVQVTWSPSANQRLIFG